MRTRGWVAFVSLCVIWGTSWIAAGTVAGHIPPFYAAGARSLLCVIVLVPVILLHGIRVAPRPCAPCHPYSFGHDDRAPGCIAGVGGAASFGSNLRDPFCSHAIVNRRVDAWIRRPAGATAGNGGHAFWNGWNCGRDKRGAFRRADGRRRGCLSGRHEHRCLCHLCQTGA